MKKYLPILISLSVLLLAVFLKSQQFPAIELVKFKVFDTYQQYFPRDYEPMGVRIIDIDDESLHKLGQWPWPRPLLGKLVTRLQELGAAVIAFDIVFAEPDRTSPGELAKLWHDRPELQHALSLFPDHDEQFAESLAQMYSVTGFVLTHDSQDVLPNKKFGMSYAGAVGTSPLDYVRSFPTATTSLPGLVSAVDGNGFFNSIPDADGVVRRIPLLLQTKGEIYPSLAMEALRVAQGASSYTVKMAGASGEASYGGTSTGITHLRNGHFEIPTDKYGNFLMYYTDTDAVNDRYISAWQVLDDNFDASLVEGHILFLGTSAPGLKDLRATPMDPSLPGVEVHAQALEQVLAEQYLVRPDWMDGAEVVMMLAFGIILIVVMAQLTAIWGAVFMVVVQAGAIYFSLHMFRTHGYLIDPISPGIAILLLYLTESLRRYISSEQERKQVRSAFGQYMSPVLVEQLAKDPNRLKLGGEMKELSVLFCDIRGFTTISEQFNAQELTAFINRFLTPMTNVILERKGTIDKYMGDCIMAFWNAPLDDEEHARNASEAALGMFAELRELNAERKMRAGEEGREYLPVNIGIGINTGEICVGNMGSEQRFDYSVLGDDVNLASRLEGQSKTYGVDIVIGENTRCQLENMALLELDLIRVKGKTSAVTIYALMGDESLYEKPAFQELVDLWKKTLKAYRTKEWDGARNFINLCRTQVAKLGEVELETLFRLYEARIAAYKITPPPEDWDGVFIATSK